jgi:putative transcriptional regulator
VKNRLQEIRKAHRISQSELARTLKISRQAVSGFESGKFTPSLEMALQIAQFFQVTVEEIFLAQEKGYMQTLVEKFKQWLPKGEKFTEEAIKTITVAQEKAALSYNLEVEPRHILYGLLSNLNATVSLLRSSNFTLEGLFKEVDNLFSSEIAIQSSSLNVAKVNQVNQFSPESQYILESSLQLARLKQSKYIKPEHLLLGLIQLVQLEENNELETLFGKIDIKSLQQDLYSK